MSGEWRRSDSNTNRLVLTNVAAGLLVGSLVAWIDWGGVDRSTSDRLLAGMFALQGTMALAAGLQLRSHRYHPSRMAAQMCGAAYTACFAVAMLSSGVTAVLFSVAGIAGITAEFRNLRVWKRAVAEGYRFPPAPRTAATMR